MAKHGIDIITLLRGEPVVPILTLEELCSAETLARALLGGGIGCVEVTLRTPIGLDLVGALARQDGLIVGAGTVLTAAQADAAIDRGARFIISPGFSEEVVNCCINRGVPVVPGVATATEIQRALAFGLTAVKLFPARLLGGLGMVRALAAPFPGLRFMPSGGITIHDVASYLAEPAVFAVGGSWMVNPTLIKLGKFDEVTRLAAATRSMTSC